MLSQIKFNMHLVESRNSKCHFNNLEIIQFKRVPVTVKRKRNLFLLHLFLLTSRFFLDISLRMYNNWSIKSCEATAGKGWAYCRWTRSEQGRKLRWLFCIFELEGKLVFSTILTGLLDGNHEEGQNCY